MQTKPLTPDTQRIVDELRAMQEAIITLHGPQANTAILTRATNRLIFLDQDRTQLGDWLQESQAECAKLKAAPPSRARRARASTVEGVVMPLAFTLPILLAVLAVRVLIRIGRFK
jgi:hypothetical protein